MDDHPLCSCHTEIMELRGQLTTASEQGPRAIDEFRREIERRISLSTRWIVGILLAPSLTGLVWLVRLGARHDALEASVAVHEQAPAHATLAETMGRVEQHLVEIDRRLARIEATP